MVKRGRVQRPKGELKAELREQLILLRHSCETYDRGLEAAGKHISLSLRVLVHEHGRSRSLLDQLGLRTGLFFDSTGPLNPRNMLTECNLVGFQMSDDGARFMPIVAMEFESQNARSIPFVDWWNAPVLKDNKRRTFSRRELVLNVADTDGGAHVDPELDEQYMALSRDNSLGWEFVKGDIRSTFAGRPELACMRQIAHELLRTIHETRLEYGDSSAPVIPEKRSE